MKRITLGIFVALCAIAVVAISSTSEAGPFRRFSGTYRWGPGGVSVEQRVEGAPPAVVPTAPLNTKTTVKVTTPGGAYNVQVRGNGIPYYGPFVPPFVGPGYGPIIVPAPYGVFWYGDDVDVRPRAPAAQQGQPAPAEELAPPQVTLPDRTTRTKVIETIPEPQAGEAIPTPDEPTPAPKARSSRDAEEATPEGKQSVQLEVPGSIGDFSKVAAEKPVAPRTAVGRAAAHLSAASGKFRDELAAFSDVRGYREMDLRAGSIAELCGVLDPLAAAGELGEVRKAVVKIQQHAEYLQECSEELRDFLKETGDAKSLAKAAKLEQMAESLDDMSERLLVAP